MSLKENLPWIEKYRPKTIDEVEAQPQTVSVLKKSLTSHNLPHLLFYGPPGTGKTSTILALARQLYGPELFHDRVLELNASDERGIQVIREKVKNFAKVSVNLNLKNGDYPCPPYKIILLDEADSLTNDAQSALRRTMETYSKVTRFCLICNYVSRIIEPLASRCAKFRFKPISLDLCIQRLELICLKENFKYDSKALAKLVEICDGDLRRGVMMLQAAYQCQPQPNLTLEVVNIITGIIPDEVIENLFQSSLTDDPKFIFQSVNDMINNGYPADQTIDQLHSKLLTSPFLTGIQLSNIGECLGIISARLNDGGDELLNLTQLMLHIQKVVNNY